MNMQQYFVRVAVNYQSIWSKVLSIIKTLNSPLLQSYLFFVFIWRVGCTNIFHVKRKKKKKNMKKIHDYIIRNVNSSCAVHSPFRRQEIFKVMISLLQSVCSLYHFRLWIVVCADAKKEKKKKYKGGGEERKKEKTHSWVDALPRERQSPLRQECKQFMHKECWPSLLILSCVTWIWHFRFN